MRVTDAQLTEYIQLYKSEYGIELDRVRALTQLHKLINLVLYLAMPVEKVAALEKELEEEYTEDAAHRAKMRKGRFD